ncbi:hypothetical protein [Hydrogenoanaerobacterium sp.]|uniref:hypothetical protein n=1 Tax=Hydrogenoanaerobacterium sp. TaxID=2953763 RepID=UPI00289FCBC5|nr:hypothetical protein [Hydrogenoanaerobacterium sp.]
MDQMRAQKLQKQLAKEAIAMLSLGGNAADTGTHEQTITLMEKAWRLPAEETQRLLGFIQQEKEVIQRLNAGEDVPHIDIDNEDVLENWTGLETLEALEDLFETSLHLDSYAERRVMFDMADILRECQNLLDWITLTKAEKSLPEMIAG